jgi:plasmid maintenance system antidote protein VapI
MGGEEEMRRGQYTRRMQSPTYTPNRLLNRAMEMLGIECDATLARKLGFHPHEISHMRAKRRYIGGEMLIRIHEMTGLTITEMRELMGEACPEK